MAFYDYPDEDCVSAPLRRSTQVDTWTIQGDMDGYFNAEQVRAAVEAAFSADLPRDDPKVQVRHVGDSLVITSTIERGERW